MRTNTTDSLDFETQPFIETITIQIAKLRIRDTILIDVPLLELFLGDKGVGKTTALFFLMKESQKLNEVYSCFFTKPPTFHALADELKKAHKFYNPYNTDDKEFIEEVAKTHKIFLFIDSHDSISNDELKNFSWVLEFLKYQKKVYVFLAMNRSHYNQMYKYTEIMGKYNHNRLEPLCIQETTQLINQRVQKATLVNQETPTLFTDEAIKVIHESARGNPRNILSACSQILYQLNSTEYALPVDEDFVKTLYPDFIVRIIKDRVGEPTTQQKVIELYRIIDANGGKISSCKALYEIARKELGFGRYITESILNKLISLDIISVVKDPANLWNKIILTKKGESSFYDGINRKPE